MFSANATLIYTQTTAVFLGNDPITGEPCYEDSANIERVSVSIEQSETEATVRSNDGKDITGVYCTGRFINPKTAPNWYDGDMVLDIEFNGKQGKFYTYPDIPSRFGLNKCFGDAIKGVLLN